MAYQGLIAEIPLGVFGLNGSANEATTPPGWLLKAQNITYEDGTLRKEGGTAKYNATAVVSAPDILAGWDWDHDGSTQKSIIVTSAGIIHKDDGAGDYTAVTLKSGLTVTGVMPVFVEGGKEAAANNRKLFIFTEKNVVQQHAADGATTTDISAPPADWSGANQPIGGFLHANRLWGYGNANDPHRLYFSTLSAHDTFTGNDAGTIGVYPGEGDGIIYATSFQGKIVVFKKPRGIYIVDTPTDSPRTNVIVGRHSLKLGTASSHSVVEADNDLIFMDRSGAIHSIRSIGDSPTPNTASSSNMQNSVVNEPAKLHVIMRKEINFAQTGKVQAIHYEAKRQIHFAFPGRNKTENTKRLVLFEEPPIKYSISDGDTPISLWLKKDADGVLRPTMGNTAGFVFDMDQDSRSKAGTGYSGSFQTSHDNFARLDPALATRVKNGQYIELVFEGKGNHTVAVSIIWDGFIKDKILVDMSSVGVELDTFLLNTDSLGAGSLVSSRHKITGQGRRFGLQVQNSVDAQDFSIAAAYLHFTPADERIQR